MKATKRIYIFSFVCIISLFLALFIMSKANYEHKKIIIIPNKTIGAGAENNEIVPAPNENIAYEEEKSI